MKIDARGGPGAVRALKHKEGGFSLGRFELPVAGVALVWVAVAIFVLVTPTTARVPSLIVLGLIAVGVGYFVKMLILNLSALQLRLKFRSMIY